MHWAVVFTSLTALLTSDSGIVLAAIVPPKTITVPYLYPMAAGAYEERANRYFTWNLDHPTPPEIIRAGMDPASPSVNEWIARAHYQQLVLQFSQWKLFDEYKFKNKIRQPQCQIFIDGDIHTNQAIEALFSFKTGALTVAVLYDPITKHHFVSTVPRAGKAPASIGSEMRNKGKMNAPVWYAVLATGSKPNKSGALNNLAYHAEDGAYYHFEKRMLSGRKQYTTQNGRKYRPGMAIGAWGGTSDYHLHLDNVHETTADASGSRYDLCLGGSAADDPRGTRGCRTVAGILGVAFNGDGTHTAERYVIDAPPASPCRRDGKAIHIRGRAVACPLNLKPPTITGGAVKAISTGLKKHVSSAKITIKTSRPTPTQRRGSIDPAATSAKHGSTSNTNSKNIKGKSSKAGSTGGKEGNGRTGGKGTKGTSVNDIRSKGKQNARA